MHFNVQVEGVGIGNRDHMILLVVSLASVHHDDPLALEVHGTDLVLSTQATPTTML